MSNKILLNPFKDSLFAVPPSRGAFQILGSSYLHHPPRKHPCPSCPVEKDADGAGEAF